VARHGLYEDQGQGVDVAAAGEGPALGLLGRRVAGRAQDRAGRLGHRGVGQRPGEPEVGDPESAVVAEEQVGGLEVPVDQALAVGVVQPAGGFEADEGGLGDAEAPALVEHGSQRPAPDELGDQEGDVVLAPVVDGQQVGVVESGGGLGLRAEAADERSVIGVGLVQELDRHPPPEAGVLGQEHLGRGPGADRGQEAVPTREDATDLVVHAGHRHGIEAKGWALAGRGTPTQAPEARARPGHGTLSG